MPRPLRALLIFGNKYYRIIRSTEPIAESMFQVLRKHQTKLVHFLMTVNNNEISLQTLFDSSANYYLDFVRQSVGVTYLIMHGLMVLC